MFSHYYRTHMEESLENTFKEIGISHAQQINIDYISQHLNVWVYYRPFRSRAIEKSPGTYTMIIDNRLSSYEQRLEFLHELGHLLRHSGNQTSLPSPFVKAQEDDAEQFLLYASMPFYILSRLQLPPVGTEAVNYIANVFNVPFTLAMKRFDQIQRREFEGYIRSSLKKRHLIPTNTLSSFHAQEGGCAPECSIFAYYDPSGECDSPTQLIIEINSQKYFQDERIPIDLHERFKRIESDNVSALTGIPVLPTDLRVIDGIPNLMLPAIAFRHGRAVKRFVVQMKDIDLLMHYEKKLLGGLKRMASFQKYMTKDGPRWMYKYYGAVDPVTGKKKPSSKRGFMTKKEAQLHAAQTEKEVAEGTFVKKDKTTTFEQVYKLWYETNRSGWKPPTRRAVRSKFKAQLLPRFKNAIMKNITKSFCQEVINKMANEGLKTVDNYKMYANQIFEFAIEKEIIEKNPMTGVKIPIRDDEFIVDKAKEEEMRNYWEKSEIKSFLEIVKNNYPFSDFCMFHLFIYTGARKGEILALKQGDIDFKNKTLKLNKTLYYDKDQGYMLLTSKTAASRRLISLDDTTLGLMRKLITDQNKGNVTYLHYGDDPNTDKLLFTRFEGNPLRLAYPNDKLDEIIRIFKLHPITVHGLRHTHASLLFEAGASIKEVQERLGHSDIKMTMNIYTHVTKTVKEQTASKFEKFLESDDEVREPEDMINDQSKK